MSEKTSSSSGGLGFGGLLTIVFITLKLCGVINWSWWWVLSPVWILAGIVALIRAFVALVYWLDRPKTPAEKAAAAFRAMADALRHRH